VVRALNGDRGSPRLLGEEVMMFDERKARNINLLCLEVVWCSIDQGVR